MPSLIGGSKFLENSLIDSDSSDIKVKLQLGRKNSGSGDKTIVKQFSMYIRSLRAQQCMETHVRAYGQHAVNTRL